MRNVYSVGQVNSYIRNMFSQDFMLRSIYVRGEVSNCKYHSSGHLYFTLKDEKGAIACVMFSGYRKGLSSAWKRDSRSSRWEAWRFMNGTENISFTRRKSFRTGLDGYMRDLSG